MRGNSPLAIDKHCPIFSTFYSNSQKRTYITGIPIANAARGWPLGYASYKLMTVYGKEGKALPVVMTAEVYHLDGPCRAFFKLFYLML